MSVTMECVLLALTIIGQPQAIDSEEFSKSMQMQVMSATVRIANRETNTTGSGVLLSKAKVIAYVLTANHVVKGADAVEVHVFSPKSYPKPAKSFTARVIARQGEHNQDLALLRISDFAGESEGLVVSPKSESTKETRTSVLSVGCADGGPPDFRIESVHGPVLAAKADDKKTARFWRSDKAGKLGESGGPIVNARGQLIGIRSGMQRESAFFCHLDEIHAFLRKAGLSTDSKP